MVLQAAAGEIRPSELLPRLTAVEGERVVDKRHPQAAVVEEAVELRQPVVLLLHPEAEMGGQQSHPL